MILIVAITAILTGFFLIATVIPWTRDLLTDRDVAPDLPQPFGMRTAWIMVGSADGEAVVDMLRLTDVQRVNWRTGIASVYDPELADHYVFVSPPVGEKTYVVGMALPHPVSGRFVDRCQDMLVELAARFANVQYYFTYPVIELYAWAKYADGVLVRAFAWGDEGAIWNRGALTPEEQALGLKVFELRRMKAKGAPRRRGDDGDVGYPTEEHVLTMAATWDQDPTELNEQRAHPGLGYIGVAPADWRVRRTRRDGARPKPTKKSPAQRRAELRPVE